MYLKNLKNIYKFKLKKIQYFQGYPNKIELKQRHKKMHLFCIMGKKIIAEQKRNQEKNLM